VGELDTPVLITGESGTGHEQVARAIHDKSSRAGKAFVPVSCGALAEDMLEAELFGLVRDGGAMCQGRLEVASGGTVFLDDIAKLGARLQVALLRVMTEGVIVPVGGSHTVAVNVRIVCASTQSPDDLVRNRIMREDLYYRLAGCSVYLPPLRERREDIPMLVEHFIEKFNREKGKSIFGASADAMTALLQHDWGNNIRELENLIERIVVLKNSGSLEVCDLPPRLRNFVTDNIDNFYERNPRPANRDVRNAPNNPMQQRPLNTAPYAQPGFHTPTMGHHHHHMNEMPQMGGKMGAMNSAAYNHGNVGGYGAPVSSSRGYEEPSDIEQFVKKEIDLGNGIDFYRVVEEFENRLISEALRRTNHNKNRAAQLLSMNRTTLVEKLKKRTSSSSSKSEPHRVKRNSAFTIFDSLGGEDNEYGNNYIQNEDNMGILDVE
jgi:DNA-binding NtrC family response regulator